MLLNMSLCLHVHTTNITSFLRQDNILFMSFGTMLLYSKWFEPRGIGSSYSVIVWVRVVLKRTVVGDNPSGSHLEKNASQSMMLQVWSVESDWSV